MHREYERLKSLQVSSLSPLYYVSLTMPYWYFNISDPEGNVLEITGPYDPSKETVYPVQSTHILEMECDEYGTEEKILP